MLEVEGGTTEWCMRILRHEAGHAIENAYLLRRRRGARTFRQVFRNPTRVLPPRPYSRSFVRHLDFWYAQSHPDEDFAETFAVWLDPHSLWKERYRGWPVMKKLEYMDTAHEGTRWRLPLRDHSEEVDPLPTMKKTLREHYEEKRRHYGIERTVVSTTRT